MLTYPVQIAPFAFIKDCHKKGIRKLFSFGDGKSLRILVSESFA